MKTYELGPRAIEQLRRVVKNDVQRAVRRRLEAEPTQAPPGPRIYLAETGVGGIAAYSGGVAGSATCTVKTIADDGTVADATDTQGNTITVTVYNVASTAVTASTLIQCKEETCTGKLLCDFEDCP